MKGQWTWFLLAALAAGVLLSVLLPRVSIETKELRVIIAAPGSVQAMQAYRTLLERAGADEGQKILARTGLPADGTTHLLNHVAGEFVYDTYGLEGLSHCKDYFLQSCFHAFFIRAVSEHGEAGITKLMESCYLGSEARARQCAHGIGHGLLAWYGYPALPDALLTCDTLKEKDARFPAENCQDGVFMENVWAVHENGIPSPERWVDVKNAQFPCTDARIKEGWRPACWANQPALLYQLSEGDIAKVAFECAQAPSTYRETCYDGLARQIHPLTRGGVESARHFCTLLGEERYSACIISIARAAYATGDRSFPDALCRSLEEPNGGVCRSSISEVQALESAHLEEVR